MFSRPHNTNWWSFVTLFTMINIIDQGTAKQEGIIQANYVYNECVKTSQFKFPSQGKSAYVIKWQETDTEKDFDPRYELVNCTYVISPRTQGTNGQYKELLYLFIKKMDNIVTLPSSDDKTVTTTASTNATNYVKKMCNIDGISDLKGCIIITMRGESETFPTPDIVESRHHKVGYYTDQPITIQIIMLYSFTKPPPPTTLPPPPTNCRKPTVLFRQGGNRVNNPASSVTASPATAATTVLPSSATTLPISSTKVPSTIITTTTTPAPTTTLPLCTTLPPKPPAEAETITQIPNFQLEITSVFGGPCIEDKSQFYCIGTGTCIDKELKCDGKFDMVNCAPSKITSVGERPDKIDCSQDTTVTTFDKRDSSASLQFAILIAIASILGAILLGFILNFLFYRPGCLLWRLARLRNCCCFARACPASKQCTQHFVSGNIGLACGCCKTPSGSGAVDLPGVGWTKYAPGDGFHMRENR